MLFIVSRYILYVIYIYIYIILYNISIHARNINAWIALEYCTSDASTIDKWLYNRNLRRRNILDSVSKILKLVVLRSLETDTNTFLIDYTFSDYVSARENKYKCQRLDGNACTIVTFPWKPSEKNYSQN